MRTYRIYNHHSGADLGAYDAETEQEALDQMAQEAGYKDYAEAQEVAPAKPGEIVVEDITDVMQSGLSDPKPYPGRAVNWRELIVTDANGYFGVLGEIAEDAPGNLDSAVIEHGKIVEWHGFFISAPGEEPDYNTPIAAVDWSGFQELMETYSR